MTVSQLVELLQTFPQDLEVITTRFSDYKLLDPEEISVVQAVQLCKSDEWYTRWHPSLKATHESKDYLHFEGN